jgi:DNA-binding response OmpR family regulator
MSYKKILIIEDDLNISKLIDYNLQKAGFKTNVENSGENVIQILNSEKYHLVILDLMLPGIDGLEVCRRIKKDKRLQSVKILMLTAKGEELDKVLGFELGADDYVVKPFSPRELVLRVKAILRREDLSEDVLYYKGLKVEVNNHTVFIEDKKINLTAMEFKLLVSFMRNKNNVQTREYLLEEVWDTSSEVSTRTIDTHVKRLRQKLGIYGKNIETERSVGYRFIE